MDKPKIISNKINRDYKDSNRGLLPPQAIEIEEAVLGAMLLEKDAVSDALGMNLRAEIFYRDAHQLIFSAIKSLYDDFKPIDFITVTNQLRTTGELEKVGGAHYVTQLITRVNSARNMSFHAQILIEEWMRRVAINMASELLKNAYSKEEDIFELIDRAQTDLINMHDSLSIEQDQSIEEIAKQALDEISKAKNTENGITGVQSGLVTIDKFTSGWQKQDVIIIAGRPGMGKTTFALNALRNAAVDFGHDCAFFSLEMRKVALFKKMIATETGISPNRLMKGQLEEKDWATLHQKVSKIVNKKIHLIDKAYKFSQLRTKLIKLKAKHDIKLAVIDYLQLAELEGRKGNREQEIAQISRGIKNLAMELDIPIIALSQLSRQVENRPDKRPMLSDLRESGSIEQDADVIIFPFRPEYYKIDVDEHGNSLRNKAEIIFAKHRNGPVGSVMVDCDLAKSKFYVAEEIFERQYNPNQFTEPTKEEEDPF